MSPGETLRSLAPPPIPVAEDVGGSWGYEQYLAVLADPTHEAPDHLSGWRGPFDPKAFDLALVNAHLQAVR